MTGDFTYALRQLRRSPGLAAAVLLTLALAIGVNTAVFSLLDGFLLRALPYPHPERLAALLTHEQLIADPSRSEEDDSSDNTTWQALLHDVPTVDAAIAGDSFGDAEGINLSTATDPRASLHGPSRYVHGARVSARYFQVLGVQPLLGRGFTADEDRPGAGKAAVLSYNLWQTSFAGDPGILGKAIDLRGAPYIVVGVLPQGATMPNPADLWTPLMPDDPNGSCVGNNCLILMRLKPGATWNQVRGQLAHLPPPRNVDLRRERFWYYPSPVQAYAGRSIKAPTEVLMLAVGFILLIACANLAGLSLARMSRRTPEIATRLALGATRARILRQLWIENLVLAVGGGAAGLALALTLFPVMKSLLPEEMIPIGGFSPDSRVLAFTAAVSILASFLFGALPALESRRVDLHSALSSLRATSHAAPLRQILIAAEVALTIVLLAAAGLLVRTIAHLESLPPGFDAANVMTAEASLDDARYRDAAHFHALLRDSLAAMRRIPGVESAAAPLSLPYERGLNDGLRILDGPHAGLQDGSSETWVTPDFFRTLRIPVVSGRVLRESDTAGSLPVAVVNEAFGLAFFNSSHPVGLHFRTAGTTFTIVGVVPDIVKSPGMTRGTPLAFEPVFYISAAQFSQEVANVADTWFQPSWIVRTHGPISGLTEQMQGALASVDPSLPFAGFYSMRDLLNRQLQIQRIEAALLGTLAVLALLLSAIGVYALVSHLVVQRTREIGIRLALGSTLEGAIRQIASSGLVAAGLGAVAGLLCSLAALRFMKTAIYGITPWDPVTLIAVPCLLLAIAAAASVLPALRIARIDPAQTLRAE